MDPQQATQLINHSYDDWDPPMWRGCVPSPIEHTLIGHTGHTFVPTPLGWKPICNIPHSYHKNWLAVSQGHEGVQQVLSQGWDGVSSREIYPLFFKNYKLEPQSEPVLEDEILTMLNTRQLVPYDKDFIQTYGPPITTFPFFVVKEENWVDGTYKFRPIADARYGNQTQDPPSFELPTIKTFLSMLGRGDFTFKIDIKSGWTHFGISPQHSRRFAVSYKGKLYRYTVLAFGDNTAPWCFVSMVVTLKKVLNKFNIPYQVYIDDFGFRGTQNCEETSQMRNKVLHTLTSKFGIVFGTKKCPPPNTSGDFLGFEYSTTEGWWRVSRNRVQKAKHWLTTWATGTPITKRALAKFCGYVASTLIIFPRGRFFIKHHLGLMSSVEERWDFSFKNVPPQLLQLLVQDSKEWIQMAEQEVRHIWAEPCKAIWLSTDATLHQAAAVLWEGLPEFIPATTEPKLKRVAISYNMPVTGKVVMFQEMYAILFGIQSFQEDLMNSNLFIAVDNQAAFFALLSGYSSTAQVQEYITKIYHLLKIHNIRLNIEWIPSKINASADHFSRLWVADLEWQIEQGKFNDFLEWCLNVGLELPTIDAFANASNTKLPQFCSRFQDTGALGDFFIVAQQLSQQCLYLNPPFALIGKVFQHCQLFKLRGWFLLPTWPAKSWWYRTKQSKHVYLLHSEELGKGKCKFTNGTKTMYPSWECNLYYFKF